MPRLILWAAGINLILAIYIIASLFVFNPETPELPLITPNPSGEETTGELIDSEEHIEDEPTNTPITEERSTLTESELSQIENSRNPFGTSPIVDKSFETREKIYQEKMAIQEAKLKRQTAEEKIMEKISRKPTEQEIDRYLLDGTIPNDEIIPNTDIINTDDTPPTDVSNNNGGGTSGNTVNNGATGNPTNTDTGNDPVKKYITKEEANKIAEEKAKKYKVPKEWLMALIEVNSKYQADLVTNKDSIERRGLTQFRQDKAKFIAESIGIYYRPSLDFNATMNIEMAAYYLSYLKGKEDDAHYVFTVFYHGEEKAKRLKSARGNYQTDFSKKIVANAEKQS